ncbi:WavE lipopolysaccharide synthesis family protein [Thiomicrorhabdus xiamenensis]|uniref:WavE lipopolysaccharide synthesis n=1 Tax=Thiomicrorhabdus xiamenensis TaxID=2739063 RepID=A0A7D4NZI8_9GAMM|nr:WavE lipopolysaccharide synthesis family protein [Thiomicrorhabdus xiamenensis]QKI89778.1 hypothetical protein HQN79_09430 [Thiomicrorhabdus xiamenensis]
MNMKNINKYSDFAFIIQGAIDTRKYRSSYVTLEVLKSIRKNFPGSELILSTWVQAEALDSELAEVSDKVVFSNDPGGIKTDSGILNVNRQIISSRKGLNSSTRKYSVKVRSDVVFNNSKLIDCFIDQVLSKLLVVNLTSVDPLRRERYFAVCDWVYVGETELLKKVFDIDLYPSSLLVINNVNKKHAVLNAEQWIVINFLDGVENLNLMEKVLNNDVDLIDLHKVLICKYFYIGSFLKLGLVSTKYKISYFGLKDMYTSKSFRCACFSQCPLLDIEHVYYCLLGNSVLRAGYRKLMGFFNG